MNSIPLRWHKALAGFARAALWILATAWISLGLLWGVLHFVIVPRIADFRPWLEQQATQRMGMEVRIGSITAQSNGLIPSVELREIRLLDSDQREALRLSSVLAALSVRSVLGLGFAQLYIDSPELDVRRTLDGRIWVAGLLLPDSDAGNSGATDWLFSQTELVLRHGKVRWTDALRGVAPLELTDVSVVIRNRHRTHAFRVDADPPVGWGSRLVLMGKLQHPLFASHPGDWRAWRGQLFAQATQVDLAQLRNYADLGMDLRRGAGSLRAWLDVDHASVQGATADLALQEVAVKVTPTLQALDVLRVSGRLGVRRLDGGFEFSTQALRFDTRDGLHWPGGNLQLRMVSAQRNKAAQGSLVADNLDLAAVTEVANRLPLNTKVHSALARLSPKGAVETLKLSWQGDCDHLTSFAANGRVAQLELSAQPNGRTGIPGVRGATVVFDLTQNAGKATLAIKKGALEFPGIFDNPVVAFDDLGADLQWKQEGARISVQTNKLHFSNADAQGVAQISWQTATVPHEGAAEQAYPGVLDLQGSLARANLAAVPRYLPRVMNSQARDYLAQALVAGEGSNVRFRVKGDLAKFPFENARQGDFYIAGNVAHASYAYAPASVMPQNSPPWPLLTEVSGELVLDRDKLQLKAAKGLLSAGTGLQISKAEVSISTLYDAPLLSVAAEMRGPLGEALAFVNASPLGVWTGKTLAHAVASGSADYKLQLAMPLDHADKATVQGSVMLAANDFQLSPAIPRLSRAKGELAFTESGFSIPILQARALGGDVRIDGGMAFGNAALQRNAPAGLRIQGTATAEGLRQAAELGPVARVALLTSGSTSYSASLVLRAGSPELLVNSNLAGMALNLPEPFAKSADSVLPLRLQTSVLAGVPLQEQLRLELGRLASVVYVRDVSGTDPKVLRGAIAVGLGADESAPLPGSGVSANLNLNQVDVDAWTAVVHRMLDSPASGGAVLDANILAYLPNSMALRAKALVMQGRTFNQVLVGGARDGLVWRGNVEATELSGYLEYRQSSGDAPGRVVARLARLVLGQTAAQDVENLLDQQPASVPALDVVVEDMELRGKKLGRVEIQADNLGLLQKDAAREWRLNRFNISTPEATLTASGNWAQVNPQSPGAAQPSTGRRRTSLNFKLDVADSGELLSRLGMPGVIAKGKGKMEGQVTWLGSPFSLDYPSMGGGFNIDVESGQFLKADPGIAKLLGVLSLQSLPRRLVLDFRDVFSEGFAFDSVRGDVTIAQGMARTSNLQMKGVNAAVLMDGESDIDKGTQHIKVLVIPEINVGSASLLYSAINPLIGLTTFLANAILRRPLMDANTQEFLVDGTWEDPHVTKVERKPEQEPPAIVK